MWEVQRTIKIAPKVFSQTDKYNKFGGHSIYILLTKWNLFFET